MCQVSDVRHGNTAALSPSFFKFCPAYNQSVYHLFVFVLSLCRSLDQAEQFYPLSSSWTFRLSHLPIDGFTRGFSSCLCNVGPYNDLNNYQTRAAFCMAIAQRVAVITYRHFGTSLRSHLQGSRIQDSWTIPNYLCKIHFNIILQTTLRSSKCSGFSTKILYARMCLTQRKRIKNSLAIPSVTYHMEETRPKKYSHEVYQQSLRVYYSVEKRALLGYVLSYINSVSNFRNL